MKSTTSKNKPRVAVAMSGGVDSAVAAYLLSKQGFEVHGFFMRNWTPLTEIENFCPWQKDFEDVRRVCNYLNIPYSSLNFEKEYKERVLSKFLSEYQNGRTPNPDILCNREIKFDTFLKKAKSLGFDYIATGHYAKLETQSTNNNELRLIRPKDREKDQTYFLCHLKQEQLKNALFPLGDLTKNQVREIARKAGLPNSDKKDSQGICFIGKLPVREFLRQHLKLTPGQVVAADGEVLGSHDGLELYTIGQRHIGIAAGEHPLYVSKKDPETKTLVMDNEDALYTQIIRFDNANWLDDIVGEINCDVQIRYRTPAIPGTVSIGRGEIRLQNPARAITPGQYAAFYKNDRLIGGAVIT